MHDSDMLLSGLNEEQKRAVSAPPDTHYLVLAGAGCGKTTVLSRRIAFLIRTNYSPDTILGVTFTRKAADEMSARVEKLLPSGSGAPPRLVTFHSFALYLLNSESDGKPHFSHLGYTRRPNHCDEAQRLQLLAKSSSSQERQVLGVDLLTLDALIEKQTVFPDVSTCKKNEQQQLLGVIRERFQTNKIHAGVWDFSDLIKGALKVLEECPETLSLWRERYRCILVDEFQDTNPLQIRLLKLLLGKTGRLFAVGDDDQAIYGFRGADIRPTVHFSDYFPGAKVLKLQINYRSVPTILTTANKLFRHKPALYRKVLVSGCYPKKEGNAPARFMFETDAELLDWLCMKVDRITSEEGILPEEMAMLFRVNQSVQHTRNYFCTRNITAHPQLLTVHAAKGLEFPVVFVGDLEEGMFPNYRLPKRAHLRSLRDLFGYALHTTRKKIDCNWEEELRLFYVAVTRAQKQLYFCAARSRTLYGRVHRCRPSRFLGMV